MISSREKKERYQAGGPGFSEAKRIQVREVLKGEKARELSWEKKRDGSYSADDESGAAWETIPNRKEGGWELFRDGNPYGVFATAARAMMRAEEDADFGPAKFERFTVPGGKNYRELCLRCRAKPPFMPTKSP